MTDRRVTNGLPPDVSQYLSGMRRLDRPVDLVDSVMAEVEATPQEVRRPLPITAAMFAAAVAASLLAVALLLRFGPPPIGPTPTPVPLDELPSAGAVRDRIPTAVGDEPAAAGLGLVWMSNPGTGEVVRLDPATGALTTPTQVSEAQPGGILPVAASESAVWAFDNLSGELVKIDPSPRSRDVLRLPVGGRVVAMAAAGNAVWLADAEADQVVRVDATSGEPTLRADLAEPTALLLDGDIVWAAYGRGNVARLEAASGSIVQAADIGTIADRLARVGDRLIVVGNDGGILSMDVADLRIDRVGPNVVGAATGEGRVWATLPSGYLVELDARSLQPVASLLMDVDVQTGLLFGEGALWTAGTDSTGAALIVKFEPSP